MQNQQCHYYFLKNCLRLKLVGVFWKSWTKKKSNIAIAPRRIKTVRIMYGWFIHRARSTKNTRLAFNICMKRRAYQCQLPSNHGEIRRLLPAGCTPIQEQNHSGKWTILIHYDCKSVVFSASIQRRWRPASAQRYACMKNHLCKQAYGVQRIPEIYNFSQQCWLRLSQWNRH